jgi:O-antigen/teichoic acid export membrane protein
MASLKAIASSLTVNIVGLGGVAVVGLFSVLLMARWMPATDFARFSMLLLVFNSIAVLDGIRPVMIHLGAQDADLGPRVRIGKAIATALGLAVTVAAFFASRFIVPGQLDTAESAVLAIGLGLYFPMSCYWGLLDSRKQTAFTGGLRSAAWFCAYGAFLAGASLEAGPIWYVAVFCAMNVVLLVAYAARFYHYYDIGDRRSEAGLAATVGRAAWNAIGFNFGALVLASVDRVVLGWTAGPVQLGLYSAVYELTTKPAALLRVISAVFYSEAAHLQTDTETLARHWLRGIRITFSLVFCAVCVVVFFRLQLTELLLGERFAAAADSFGLLALGFALVVLGYFCAIALNALGDFKSQRKAYSFAAMAMIFAAWPMVAIWGITGAGALYLAVRTVDVAVLYMTTQKLSQELAMSRAVVVAALFSCAAAFAWIGWAVPAIICLAAFALAIGLHGECRTLFRAWRSLIV